jgi:putative two-component system response regulator
MQARPRILIVDDNRTNIHLLNEFLRSDYDISVATNGRDALELAVSEDPPDLILLDIMMPEMDGYEVCRRLKKEGKTLSIPILFVTTKGRVEDEKKGLELGAVDYITKPVSPPIVKARIHNQLELKRYREYLEDLVAQRTRQLRTGYIDTIHRLTLASEYKDEDTGAHVKRISYYTKELAQRMALGHELAEMVFYASPMHDIGKVAIPDAVMLKPGSLDKEEWEIMKTHTTIGAKILEGSDSPFLQMAVDIARSHHERWDGCGYPQGLKGEKIPIAARIMNTADQYDALRSKRPYKPPFDHEKTMSILIKGDGRTMPEHFDPEVLAAFEKASATFEDIFEAHNNSKN